MNLDRRLLRLASSQPGLVLLVVGLSLAAGLLIVWQASLLTQTIQAVFLGGVSFVQLRYLLAGLVVVILLRGALGWMIEYSASALSRRIRSALREKLLRHILQSGPAFTAGEQTGELTGTLLEGIESLDSYFSQYLPAVLSAVLVPLTVWCFVLPSDLLSAAIFLLTAPLIPLFMFLIGSTAQSQTRRQWQTLSRLQAYFLDVLQGMVALKVLGRSQAQVQVIQAASERYRRVTMGVLRVAFTSALALELIATLSTAVVAVQVGLRLLYGGISFTNAFFILLLAPEFYQPLRVLGSRYHSSMAGTAAARRIFALLSRSIQSPQGFLSLDRPAESSSCDPVVSGNIVQFCEIRMQDVRFQYEEGRSTLRGVSLILQRGERVALVGTSGAGKSTLAGLLLRFIDPDSGAIFIDGIPLKGIPPQHWRSQLAWVPQKPFLFPGTILDNLRLSCPTAGLEQVIQASQFAHADEFIQALPDGYGTQLAEGGAPLSAGQVQRLALARAFLRNAQLFILDEPTASLDAEHEALLQDSLDRLLQGRTALIIAHRLNTITSADRIIVLQAGKVVQSGNHTELLRQGGLYRQMVESAVRPQDQGLAEKPAFKWPAQVAPRLLPVLSELPSVSMYPAPLSETQPSTGRLFSWLLSWIAPFTVLLCLAALAGFATIASNVALMGASAYIISAAALQPSIAELQVAIVSVRLFGLSRGVFRYLERLLSHDVTLRLLSLLRVRLYQSLEPLAPARLFHFRSGDLLARLVGDIDSLEGFYVRGLSPPLIALLIALAGSTLLSLLSMQLAIILLSFLCLAGLVLPLLSHLLGRQAAAQTVSARSQLGAVLVNCIQGLPELVLFEQVGSRIAQILSHNQEFARAQRSMSLVSAFQTSMSGLLANLCLWFLLLAAIPLVASRQLDGVYLAAILLAALACFEALAPLPQSAQNLKGNLEASRRLYELVNAQPEVIDINAPLPAPTLPRLQVDKLSFRYPSIPRLPSGQVGSGPVGGSWVLQEITFDLPPTKRLALVGPSGSGKSTLISLLLRFWEFHNGQILLEDRDLRLFSQTDVRKLFAVLPQNPYIFYASLMDNLLLGNPHATQKQIEGAIQAASISEFISSLPQGLLTWVGEQGVRLSSGERQRLALARTLLNDSPVLLLDEPTAFLDAITERNVMDSLLQVSHNRSLLLVTHRLVGMQSMDEILVLSSGKVVESGSHSELIQSNGLYRRMWDLQRQQMFA